MKIDRFYDSQLGWHFHVYSGSKLCSSFGMWWTKRCDCGVNVGKREIRFTL
jgi:hypothetical protein